MNKIIFSGIFAASIFANLQCKAEYPFPPTEQELEDHAVLLAELEQYEIDMEPVLDEYVRTYFEALCPGEEADMTELFNGIQKCLSISRDKQNVKLTKWQKEQTIGQRDAWKAQEVQYIQTAQGISTWAPEINMKNKCANAFESTLVAISSATIQTKIVMGLIVQIKSYLQGVWDAWDKINYNLQESKKAAVWVDYYQRILDNDANNFPEQPPKKEKPKKDKKGNCYDRRD